MRKTGVVSISKDLRKPFENKKVKIFIDKENNLVGFQPSDEGYTLLGEKFTCRRLTKQFEHRKYSASWSEEHGMVVADISSILS
jgi:hypothetical protein